ncbi:hypothetical protein [Micromonospora sp. NBC_01638]|uniref:hypothetical protein n=1 Tax=Micromonospora sp. NBC_01638 TaxID=2975982 RepID=UPI00386B84F5|nr:hypothetical protein OG811_22445 [Micromonospora sp. NBC_01638]
MDWQKHRAELNQQDPLAAPPPPDLMGTSERLATVVLVEMQTAAAAGEEPTVALDENLMAAVKVISQSRLLRLQTDTESIRD